MGSYVYAKTSASVLYMIESEAGISITAPVPPLQGPLWHRPCGGVLPEVKDAATCRSKYHNSDPKMYHILRILF